MRWAGAAGLLAGYAADQVLGDPRRGHPVAVFGSFASSVQQRMYADDRARGAAFTATLVGAAAGLGLAADRVTARQPLARWVVTAVATWAVLGGRSLTREADILHAQLADGDLPAARRQVRNLVGRDPSQLDAQELARATIESVAENTSDAVVAPLMWGAIAGVPGLLGYRAANTLDAMVGHKTPRLRRFGWAAARFDDVLNYLPARVSGALAAALAPAFGARPREVVRVVRRDAGKHPSPNAGVVEAAFAGVLGVRLGGANVYEGEVEDRGTLGDGPPPAVADIHRASRLSSAVGLAAVGLAAAGLAAAGRRARRRA
ncbi:cobalamin biosynthesis protein [Epidermidibacterium keratini]|uniref:Cobalamin biosynthesis protein CobD n=1 Tax=Epidermidibacterium keratini TaxID=1891644 RepID=A0A7L4YTI1_9ACTN|nr:cobalamin biosynthesis protein [Epidermidibacterium keratini]